jgi:hypothetical protein
VSLRHARGSQGTRREHALNVDPKAKPVKQPLRRFDEPKRKAIGAELHRLENVGFIKEIKASTWVSNPVIALRKIRTYKEYVSTSSLSINIALRIPFHYLELIR